MAEQSNLSKILGTFGNTAKSIASDGFSGGDLTPGYSLRNVLSTQAGNIFGGGSAPTGASAGAAIPRSTSTTTQQAGSGNLTAGGASGGTDAQDRANALFGIDSGLSSANDALGRLGNQEQVGYGNIDRQYQDAYNRLLGSQQIGERNYNTNKNNQLNEYEAARNQSATAARGWLDSARRTLGAQGAGGGSAARYGVPYQAQTMAATGNAQAQATNNRNITALDQGYQDDQDKFKNSFGDLLNQKSQGENDYRSQIEQQRAQLLSTIGSLTGQKQIANGGDYKSALAASQPYTSKISDILNHIDSLAATPNVREQAVTLSRPDLSGYNWAAPDAPVAAQQDTSLNPLLALLGLQDDNRQQQQFV